MDVIKRRVYLYGEAKIDYGDISITAGRVEIDWSTNIMTAMPALDSSGKKIEIPVFKDKEGTYVVDTARYNFKTKKGISKGVITQQGEGYIHGQSIKKSGDNLFISSAKYTTCNLNHPHFYINARKLKVIPQDKIVSGPFNLVVSDVPTPLGFFLGFFPMPKKQKSGLIIPTGGSGTRGFFLREGGYYWAVNDYLGLRVIGDAYANGSFRSSFIGDYTKRYGYAGHWAFNLSNIKQTFEDTEPFSRDVNVQWTHRTQTKKNSSLSATVNAGSPNFYKRNSYNPTSFQQGTFNSDINYYKMFANTPLSLNIRLHQDQNISTKVMNFTLPEATFAMNRIYPFKGKGGGRAKIYENINLAYTLDTKIQATNNPSVIGTDSALAFNGKNLPFLLSKAQYGARHNIPISTTIKPTKTFLKYFNITPNLTYQEFWYPYHLDYKWNTLNHPNALEIDTVNTISRTYAYNGSMNLSTTIYGRYKFKSKKLLEMRHTLIPTFGFTYKPDFTKNNFVNVQTDIYGNKQQLSRYAGFIYGGPTQRQSSLLTFNLNNTFEGKIRTKKDTVTGIKKIKIIDQLNISGFYDFAAKQNKLSLINLTARTRFFDRIDVQSTAILDPYKLGDTTGTQASNLGKQYIFRSDTFTLSRGLGLARLVNYNIGVTANLNPKAKLKQSTKGPDPNMELRQINMNPNMYVDFKMPWTLYATYTIGYSKPGILPAVINQSLSFNGDVRITSKWKIGFNSGYDLRLNKFTTTRIDIYRDLHCWQMSFNIVPFGIQRSYAFTISAKSSILQDLKLNKKSAGYYGTFY